MQKKGGQLYMLHANENRIKRIIPCISRS